MSLREARSKKGLRLNIDPLPVVMEDGGMETPDGGMAMCDVEEKTLLPPVGLAATPFPRPLGRLIDSSIFELVLGAMPTKSLGCLAQAHPRLRALVDHSDAWRTKVKAVPRIYKIHNEYGIFNKSISQTWDGEDCLPDHFLSPSPALIGGWKKQYKMLASRNCEHCGGFQLEQLGDTSLILRLLILVAGAMTCCANPLRMERICNDCVKAKLELSVISASKAKENFLLSEKDVASLPTVLVTSPFFNKIGTSARTMSILSMKDVLDTAVVKWKGQQGLLDEIKRRSAAAEERYTKRCRSLSPIACGEAHTCTRTAHARGELLMGTDFFTLRPAHFGGILMWRRAPPLISHSLPLSVTQTRACEHRLWHMA